MDSQQFVNMNHGGKTQIRTTGVEEASSVDDAHGDHHGSHRIGPLKLSWEIIVTSVLAIALCILLMYALHKRYQSKRPTVFVAKST